MVFGNHGEEKRKGIEILLVCTGANVYATTRRVKF